MIELTFEERNLVCIYSASGTREGVIEALRKMRGYLGAGEDDLQALTDSALSKLNAMSDADFEALDLTPDYDPEDAAYGE